MLLGATRQQTVPIVLFYRLTDILSSASGELEKSKQTIKRLQEQQQSAREFLNMKHFTFDKDSKLARYVDKFTVVLLLGKLIVTLRYKVNNRYFFLHVSKR